jgi:glucose-1-phosphate thymidylyltransferase
MKAIVLAGGKGTRLYPITQVVCKQLLPVYDKPMIYYPLSVLMLAEIREICIISTPRDLPIIKNLLGTGEQWGLSFSYCEQSQPEGIAQALLLAENFIEGEDVCLILGDNLFYGVDFGEFMMQEKQIVEQTQQATIFAYQVQHPEQYGIVEFGADGKALSLEEKPRYPKSRWAVTGIYMYPKDASKLTRTIRRSSRGEFEITALNNVYLRKDRLKCRTLGRGFAWLDTGTAESLLEAGQFIEIIERRQGFKIACLEEIAWRKKWVSREILEQTLAQQPNISYKKYLLNLLQDSL